MSTSAGGLELGGRIENVISQCSYLLMDGAGHPVAYGRLVALARSGELSPGTLVSLSGSEEWFPAGDVTGLFHQAGRAVEVSLWRAERRNQTHVLSAVPQGEMEPAEAVPAQEQIVETSSSLNEEPDESEFSEEIQAATYEAALEWAARHRNGAPVEGVERESRLSNMARASAAGMRRGLRFLLSLPFVWVAALWRRTRIEWTFPPWLGRVLDVVFSRDSLIVAFRWGMTLAIPNLVAWGILSWSALEAQRFPSENASTLPVKKFPIWGACSSSGEFTFLLIDAMLISGVIVYFGIGWIEAKLDD